MAVDVGAAKGRIELDVSGAIRAATEAGQSIRNFQSTAATAMVAVGVAVGAATTALRLMQKGWATLERGAEIDAVQTRFERLADSIGSSGDALMARLQDATNGMMTSAELMSSATDIMSLGLGKTEDQTVRLATVVGKLGWDMQQVVLTMANNSKMRLDALGLSVEDVTKRAKALEEQGYSTDAAFDMAVIEAGEAKIELLGDTSQTTAGKIKVLKAAVQEARDAFATAFTDELIGKVGELTSNTEALAQELEYAAVGAGKLAGTLFGPGLNLVVGLGKMEEVRALGQEYQRLGGDLGDLQAKYQALFSGRLRGAEEEAMIKQLKEEIELLQRAANRYDAWNRTRYVGSELEQKLEDEADRRRRAELRADETGTRLSLNLSTHLLLVGERFKEATAGSGKFGSQLDAVAERAARAKAAIDAAAERAAAYGEAFGNVQADYVTELPNADKPLVAPQQDVTIRTRISGPTAEQADLAARYRDELERLGETYTELVGGVGTFGMEQDKLTERITAVAGEMSYYQGLLDALPPAVDTVSTAHEGLKVNVDAVHQALYDQLVEIGAAPEVVTAYAAATGIMSQAQAEAALTAARVKIEIESLAERMKEEPTFTLDQAMAELDAFIAKIEQGAGAAAATLATDVPARVTEMKDAMSEEATAAGEAVPTNIAKGMTDTLEEATTAATDAADAIVQAVRDAHGIESPSSVFAEIGAQDIAGWAEGVTDSTGEAVQAMEGVAQATVDAWDEAVASADEIGAAMMDGVIAGVESRRGELVAKMREIALQAHDEAMAAINAHSPSVLFMEMGEAMIDGVIVGVDREEQKMLERMRTLAGAAREEFAQELLAFQRFGLADALTDAAGGLLGVGQGLWGLQADRLEANIDQVTDEMTAALDGLRSAFGNTAIDNLLEMDPAKRAYFLRTLRGENAAGNQIVRQQLEAAIQLADRRNGLEAEYIRQQEALARLEAQRAQLDFLGQQLKLLEIIYDNNLDASILDGLTLGLEANTDDLVEAMRRAVAALIAAAEDDLEIHSPSRVGYGLTENFMEAMARGIRENADGPIEQLARAYDEMEALGERFAGLRLSTASNDLAAQWLRGAGAGAAGAVSPATMATAADLKQYVTIYGGVNVTGQQQATEPLRDLFFANLGYQRG